MRNSHTNGFTMIELMIALAVMGILAVIAYPSYINYIAQVRRSDATSNLLRIAALQERFMTQCGRYAATLSDSCAAGTFISGLSAAGDTPDGNYTITLAAGATGSLNTSFILTATPKLGSAQATRDSGKCTTFTFNNIGQKTATGTEGNLTNGGSCWKK
jgi:type IV pilus assembly protein PilE